MRWILVLSLLCSCRTVPTHAERLKRPLWEGAEDAPTLDVEEYAVMSVAIAENFKKAAPGAIVMESTIRSYPNARKVQEKEPTDPTDPTPAYRAGFALGGRLEDKFAFGHVHLISPGEQAAYWKGTDCEEGWRLFWADHEGQTGIVQVSRVGFSPDRSKATLEVGWQGGCLCGGGTQYFLERVGTTWRIVSQHGTWVS